MRRSRALIGSNVMILVARAVPLGVHDDVAARFARAHDHSGRQVLDGVEDVAFLADDAPGVRPLDLDADLVR